MEGKTLTFPAPVRNNQTSSENYDLPQDGIRCVVIFMLMDQI